MKCFWNALKKKKKRRNKNVNRFLSNEVWCVLFDRKIMHKCDRIQMEFRISKLKNKYIHRNSPNGWRYFISHSFSIVWFIMVIWLIVEMLTSWVVNRIGMFACFYRKPRINLENWQSDVTYIARLFDNKVRVFFIRLRLAKIS